MNTHYLAQTKTGKNFICSVDFADKHVAALRKSGAIRLRMVSYSEFPNSSTPAESAVVPRSAPVQKFNVGDRVYHKETPHIHWEILKVEFVPSGYRYLHVGHAGQLWLRSDDGLFRVGEWHEKQDVLVQQTLPVTVPTQDAPKPQNEAIPPRKWRSVEQVSDLTKGQTVLTYAGKGMLKHFVNDGWWWVAHCTVGIFEH